MLSALWKIVEFFSALWAFVKMLIKGIWMLITIIPKGLAFLVQAVTYIPPPLIPFAIAAVVIPAALFIIGRKVE